MLQSSDRIVNYRLNQLNLAGPMGNIASSCKIKDVSAGALFCRRDPTNNEID